MGDPTNPLVPAGFDIVWSVLLAIGLVLAVVALISIARAAKRLSASQSLLWTLLVLFLPIVGSVTWLAIGRRAAPKQALVVDHSGSR